MKRKYFIFSEKSFIIVIKRERQQFFQIILYLIWFFFHFCYLRVSRISFAFASCFERCLKGSVEFCEMWKKHFILCLLLISEMEKYEEFHKLFSTLRFYWKITFHLKEIESWSESVKMNVMKHLIHQMKSSNSIKKPTKWCFFFEHEKVVEMNNVKTFENDVRRMKKNIERIQVDLLGLESRRSSRESNLVLSFNGENFKFHFHVSFTKQDTSDNRRWKIEMFTTFSLSLSLLSSQFWCIESVWEFSVLREKYGSDFIA